MRPHLFSRLILSLLFVSISILANATHKANATDDPKIDWSFKTCKAFSPTQLNLLRIEDSAKIYDIHFTSCDGHTIDAYWVTPENDDHQKHAAILFVHWLDFNVDDSNRNEFLPDAKALAKQGASSLLVSTFWSVPGGRYKERHWENDYTNTLNQTRDLLQALKWIKQQSQTDLKKLTYVGHDYGGSFGAIVSGVDADVKFFVLLTPIAKLTDWYLYGSATGVPQGDDKTKFIESFVAVNPETQIKKSHAKFLLQYALSDHYVSRDQAGSLINVMPKGSDAHFYPIDHSMKLPLASEERMTWLRAQLFPTIQ